MQEHIPQYLEKWQLLSRPFFGNVSSSSTIVLSLLDDNFIMTARTEKVRSEGKPSSIFLDYRTLYFSGLTYCSTPMDVRSLLHIDGSVGFIEWCFQLPMWFSGITGHALLDPCIFPPGTEYQQNSTSLLTPQERVLVVTDFCINNPWRLL